MANLNPVPGWDDVPQIETTTVAKGGPGGPANDQAQALLNRTAKLAADVATAQGTANTAKTTADGAASAAASAQTTATNAGTAAATAQGTANTAKTTADNAAAAATTAQTTADTAQTTANTAKTTADNAASTASTAQTTANTAKTTADNAAAAAATAQTTANAAVKSADLSSGSDTAKGAALVGYTPGGTGTVGITLQDLLTATQRSILSFGASPSAAPAVNDAAFAAANTWLQAQSAGFDTKLLTFPSGTFRYTVSPNWAAPRAFLQCEPGTVFKFEGSGIAVKFDGGATGAGIHNTGLMGAPMIIGNAACTTGLLAQSTHRATYDVRVRDVSQTAIDAPFNVCSEFRLRCTPVGEPSFSVTPTVGLLLRKRADGAATSACTITNPMIEGVSSYGISVDGAIMNTFIGGTSESNGGGAFISADAFGNTFVNTDFEFNTTTDVYCAGVNNHLLGVLSDKKVEFAASSTQNVVIGGRMNAIVNAGTANAFRDLLYGIASGAFTDTGTDTFRQGVRSLSGFLADKQPHMIDLINLGGANLESLLIGNAASLSGGSVNDVDIFKRGTGTVRIRTTGGGIPLAWNQNGIGFYGATPVAKQTVTGQRGSGAALISLTTALANLGLIADGTTA